MVMRQWAQHGQVIGVNLGHGSGLGDGLRWVKVGCMWGKENKRRGRPSGAGCCWANTEPHTGAGRAGRNQGELGHAWKRKEREEMDSDRFGPIRF
jgi:hypothetical protein